MYLTWKFLPSRDPLDSRLKKAKSLILNTLPSLHLINVITVTARDNQIVGARQKVWLSRNLVKLKNDLSTDQGIYFD